MSAPRTAPTRTALLRARRELEHLKHGLLLLRKRQKALVLELFRAARPAVDALAAVSAQAGKSYEALLQALSARGEAELRHLGWPSRTLEISLEAGTVWGVPTARIVDQPAVRRTPQARAAAPGTAGTSAERAADEFEQLTELLLASAPRELLVRRLAEALSRTLRLVNTIEQRRIPELRARIDQVRTVLDEREREERVQQRWLRLRAPRRRD